MMNWHYGWGYGFGWVSMILFWLLVIAGIVAIVKWLTIPAGKQPSEKNALDILNERYARGEIGREEYEQKRRDIQRDAEH